MLASRYPGLFLLRYFPFTTPAFREFCKSSTTIIDRVEAETSDTLKQHLGQLPERYAATVSGALQMALIKQEQQNRALEQRNVDMQRSMLKMMQYATAPSNSKKRKEHQSQMQEFIRGTYTQFQADLI